MFANEQTSLSQRPTCGRRTKRKKAPPSFGEAFFTSISIVYTLKLEPQPQVDFTWGFSNLNPAASSVST